MLEGKAQGGPLAGVKVSAQPDWNGIIYYSQQVRAFTASVRKAHAGRYKWDTDVNTWVWWADEKIK